MNIFQIIQYILAGFVAQMIDGSMGMAYGISTASFLLASGVSIRCANVSIHIAEIFTTFTSGLAHLKSDNIDWKIITRIVGSGVIGSGLGTYTLIKMPEEIILPIVSVYLVYMGGRVIYRSIKSSPRTGIKDNKLIAIGLLGGFLDSIGGGGWGPIVTSSLLASGCSTRYAIGTVNFAEFFITIVQSFALLTVLNIGEHMEVIFGLAIGGIFAAPLASIICKKIPERIMMLFVGILIILLNTRNLFFGT